jgi:hypothetical protein
VIVYTFWTKFQFLFKCNIDQVNVRCGCWFCLEHMWSSIFNNSSKWFIVCYSNIMFILNVSRHSINAYFILYFFKEGKSIEKREYMTSVGINTVVLMQKKHCWHDIFWFLIKIYFPWGIDMWYSKSMTSL